MRGLIVKEGEFPHRRKTSCCGKETRAGDSVIVFEIRIGGAHKGHQVVHKRCIECLCEVLPADAADTEHHYKVLREEILRSGNAFPEIEMIAEPRGVRAELLVLDEMAHTK